MPVAAWRDEDDHTIVTAINVLKDQAEEVKRKRGRR